MGNAQAAELGKCGYRVLGVQPNSPASKVGLVSFFDFIVAADGECSCLARAVLQAVEHPKFELRGAILVRARLLLIGPNTEYCCVVCDPFYVCERMERENSSIIVSLNIMNI